MMCPDCRLPSPPVETVELNPLAAQTADLGHDYEDIRKYSAANPPAGKDVAQYSEVIAPAGNAAQYSEVIAPAGKPTTGDAAQYDEVPAPAGKPAAGDGDYDVVEHPVPTGGPTVSGDDYEVVRCNEFTGAAAPVGGTTTDAANFDITKCPAYAHQGQRSVAPLKLEEGSVVYTNIKSE